MNGQGRPPHEVRWDDVAGRRVRSLRASRPGQDDAGRPRVVLVPGLGTLGYLISTLHGCSAWSQATLLDVPGFGHRRPLSSAPVLPDVAALTAEWLRSVCDGPAVLVGHSTGAQVALHAARAVPDRVAALIMAGPTFPPSLRTLAPLAPAILRDLRYESPRLISVLWPYFVRGGPISMLRFIRSAQRDRPEDLITSVRSPVTVIRGEHDAFCPATWAGRLAASAPDGQLVTVPGAHDFPYRHGGLTAAIAAQLRTV
jgi:pimeloyl-ACP methyl ester carboxylesterase